MKSVWIMMAALLFSLGAIAEEGGEHGEKKPPPKPFKGSPVAAVLDLPIVKQWKASEEARSGHLTAWGESVNEFEGHRCWSIVVGESRFDGLHPWRRFCVPQDGGDILVESVVTDSDADITYTPYAKWVSDCKPTDTFQGSC